MPRMKCVVSYDGTNFHGYQVQPNKRTVQHEIETVLKKMHQDEFVRIYSSGRTDTGVHARAQVFHFDTELNIPTNNWKKALNAQLPDDICIKEVSAVSEDFHARFSAVEKEYRYYIKMSDEMDVFQRNYRYIMNERLDFSLMNEACKVFEGTHDFTAFSSARSTVKGDKVRTLYEVVCIENDDDWYVRLRGDGFLYHMVRIIVGVIIEAGRGKVTPKEIEEMFQTQSRGKTGKTLPPQGLYLWDVTYES